MRIAGIIVGLLAAAMGVVWLLQGLEVAFAPESFMTSNRQWVVIGGLTAIGGLALATWSWRRR
jgi:hypothetical protein